MNIGFNFLIHYCIKYFIDSEKPSKNFKKGSDHKKRERKERNDIEEEEKGNINDKKELDLHNIEQEYTQNQLEDEFEKKKVMIKELNGEGKKDQKGRIAQFKHTYDRKGFIDFLKGLDNKNQFQVLSQVQGFSARIFYFEKENQHHMKAYIFEKNKEIARSPIKHETTKKGCLRRIENWIVQQFLTTIKSENIYLYTFSSDKNNISYFEDHDKLTKKLEDNHNLIAELQNQKTELEKEIEKKQEAIKLVNQKKKEIEEIIEKEKTDNEKKYKVLYKKFDKLLKTYYETTGELKNLQEEELNHILTEFQNLSKEEPGFACFDNDNQPLYLVQDISAYKKVNGEDLYLVQWAGYRQPSWEPKSHLGNISPRLLQNARENHNYSFTNAQKNTFKNGKIWIKEGVIEKKSKK